MLWFVGFGLSGIESISVKTKEILENADIVYLEQFTSPLDSIEVDKIRTEIKGQFKIAKRWLVEDGKEILDNSKKKTVVLLTYGDPYIATTHIELRTRAIKENIETKTIHAASSVTSLIGECGLHYYKIGQTLTLMDDLKSMTTPYYGIYRNVLAGNHTLLLLEYNHDENFFLNPTDAFKYLLETEKEQKRSVILPSTFIIVASRIGSKNQQIISGKISNLQTKTFGKPPHSIVIPGSLHFTEVDALKVLTNCFDEPLDNSKNIKKISHQMLEKYVPMVKKALDEIAPHYNNSKEFLEVLENAKLYINDAEKFLEQGKDEVAVLSIGYADGLVDALRIAKGLERKI